MKKNQKRAVVLLGSLALSFVLSRFEFSIFEAHLYDFQMTHNPLATPSSEIVEIRIDAKSTQALKELTPLSISSHEKLLSFLLASKPKAVGYFIDFHTLDEMSPGSSSSKTSEDIVSMVREYEEKGGAFLLASDFDVTGELPPPGSLKKLPHSIALIHKDGNLFSEDKVTRRALLELYGTSVFHQELLKKAGLIPPRTYPRGTYDVEDVQGKYFMFRYYGNTANNRSPYPVYSASDLILGILSPEALKNKIVVVGTENHTDPSDFAYTPYSKDAFTHLKLTLHATILDSLLKMDGIQEAPPWVNFLISFFMIALVMWIILNSTPTQGLLGTLSIGVIFFVFSLSLFSLKGIWLQSSQTFLGLLISYYLVVPYRLILENRKRYDFQKKHEMLSQVEKLKTNFLSLVTHDLKTPVARIQGLTELVLKKSTGKLEAKENESLKKIADSTEELDSFISKILELTKVESEEGLRIQLESKDMNQLIEKCAERLKILAKEKSIQLELQLEPLFPIKFDPQLITKVLTNVIDNAIKYSPKESTVTIYSRESSDSSCVEIEIQDQGIGMTEEECSQLFTKFYRAKNSASSEIKGTGLGLYLTKFFIEAHLGEVDVRSTPGSGTTFILKIPMDLEESKLGWRGLKTSKKITQSNEKNREKKNV